MERSSQPRGNEVAPAGTGQPVAAAGTVPCSPEQPYPDCAASDLIAAQIARTPERIAASDLSGASLRYGELGQRAAALAHRLRAARFEPGEPVGIFLGRSVDILVAILGVWQAGRAYLPLDPSLPSARIEGILADAGATVVVSDRAMARTLPEAVTTIRVDEMPAKAFPPQAPAPAPPAEDLAYVIYTSGSTGRPKGVEITHRSLVNLLTSMAHTPGFSAADTMLALTTLSFDIAGVELLLPLVCGGRIVIAAPETAMDAATLGRLLRDQHATVMQATPSTWRAMLDVGVPLPPGLAALCGGEALPRDLAESLLSRGLVLWNLYGPTETTIWSTAERVTTGTGLVPIGRALANTQLHVLDERRQVVPAGEAGELYIGGDGVARGYRNRPDLTRERFIPDPFRGRGFLYRTGDIVRRRPDGAFEFLSRADDQIKLRGYRIEPGEIEAALRTHPAVSNAVVLADQSRLVAYVVRRPGARVTVSGVRRFLSATLPAYMVPGAFVWMDALPRTPNGKLDRRALPAPDAARPDVDAEFAPPRDAVERTLVGLCREILRTRDVGIHDNLFDLGVDSLTMLTLTLGIEEALGTRLPPAALFARPTIAQLAERLRQDPTGAEAWSPLVPVRTAGTRPPFFWIHGDHSTVPLCRSLGNDQPFYGLEHQSQDGRPAAHQSVEDIAACYLREIETVQPHGPYFLGGYSFGGVVALEVSRQIEQRGEAVALLALLDPPSLVLGCVASDRYSDNGATSARSLRREWRRHVSNLRSLDLRAGIDYVVARAVPKAKHALGLFALAARVQALGARFALAFGRPLPVFARSQYILDIYARAIRLYRPHAFDGRALLIRGTELEHHPVGDWEHLLHGRLDVHEIDAGHMAMREEPCVAQWAGLIDAALAEAQHEAAAGAPPQRLHRSA